MAPQQKVLEILKTIFSVEFLAQVFCHKEVDTFFNIEIGIEILRYNKYLNVWRFIQSDLVNSDLVSKSDFDPHKVLVIQSTREV